MLSTTELLVEHIISGILSLIWIFAIVLCFIDIDWTVVEIVKDYWAISAILVTSISYPIGIGVDTVADRVLSAWDQRIKSKYYTDPSISVMGLIKKIKDNYTTNYFTYNRFKIRVARSSSLNFLMIGIFVPICILVNRSIHEAVEDKTAFPLVIFGLFIGLSALTLFVWRDVTHTVHKRTKRFWGENTT
jgi:hypothetical protein